MIVTSTTIYVRCLDIYVRCLDVDLRKSENKKHETEGGRKNKSISHVKLFNVDVPDKGGGVSDTVPSLKRHTKCDVKPNTPVEYRELTPLSYGQYIGKGTQGLTMLAWRTASLLYRRLLIVV